MRQLDTMVLAVAATLCAVAGAAPGATVPSTSSVNGRRGEDVYLRQGCYQCHGLVGQGSILSGPALVPLTMTSRAFRSYVRNPAGAMPAYTIKILSEDDLAAIEEHVRTFDAPKPASQIPLLARYEAGRTPGLRSEARTGAAGAAPEPASIVLGKQLYVRSCAACHGAARDGGTGPDLRNEARKRDLAATVNVIVNPPPRMPNLSPSPLSRDQVRHIAAYIRATP